MEPPENGIEEIRAATEGESQLNLRAHPLQRACAGVCTRHSGSPVGINNAITKEKLRGAVFTAKNKTEEEKLLKDSWGVGIHYTLILL